MISAMLPRFLQNLAPSPAGMTDVFDQSETARSVRDAANAHQDAMVVLAAAASLFAIGFVALIVYAVISDALDG
jgi:hypothetical protein